jgi:hypothetical protein
MMSVFYYLLLTIWVGISQISGKPVFRTQWHLLAIVSAITLFMTAVVFLKPFTVDMPRYLAELLLTSERTFIEAMTYGRFEPAFALYQWVIGQITTAPFFFMGMTMGIMWILLILALDRVAPAHFLPLFLFGYLSFFEYFNLNTNLLRQGFMIHLMLLALVMLKDNRYIKPALLLAAGIFFHISGVIAAMLLLLRKWDPSIKLLLTALGVSIILMFTGLHQQLMNIVAGVIGGGIEDAILRFSSDRFYESYGEVINRLDFLAFTLFWAVWGLWMHWRYLPEDLFYTWIVKAYLAFSSVFALFAFIAYSDRIAIFAWILTPLLLFYPVTQMQGRRQKIFIAGGIFLAAVLVIFLELAESFQHVQLF